MDEMRVVGAFLWDQVGKRPTTAETLQGALSFELRWFTPKEARSVVAQLVASGLFQAEGTQLTAAPKLSGVEVPRGFHPSPDFLRHAEEPEPPSLLDRIFQAVMQSHQGNPNELLAEANRTATELGVPTEGAALLVAWRRGVRPKDLLEEFVSNLKSTAK